MEHPRLEDAEGLDDDHLLVFVVDADEYEPPTYYSFKDIKKRTIGRRLTDQRRSSRSRAASGRTWTSTRRRSPGSSAPRSTGWMDQLRAPVPLHMSLPCNIGRRKEEGRGAERTPRGEAQGDIHVVLAAEGDRP